MSKAEAKIERMKQILKEVAKNQPPHGWGCGVYEDRSCNCLNGRIRKELE